MEKVIFIHILNWLFMKEAYFGDGYIKIDNEYYNVLSREDMTILFGMYQEDANN